MNIYLTIHEILNTYVNKNTGEKWSDVEEELAEHCKRLYDIIEYVSRIKKEELDDTQEWLKEILFTYHNSSEQTVNKVDLA